MDGNFVSQHLRMQNPADDVPLSDGHGFMVESGPYEEHLKKANETREVMHLFLTDADIFSRMTMILGIQV